MVQVMNFINHLNTFRLIFFTLMISCNTGISASTSFQIPKEPLVYHFSLPYEVQNQKITDVEFDQNGLLYICTPNRLCMFNGTNWNYVSLNDPSFLEISSDNSLYIASKNKIYTLGIDSSHSYRLNEFITLDSTHTIQQFMEYEDELYLIMNDLPFRVVNDSPVPIEVEGSDYRFFTTGDYLFTSNSNQCYILKDGVFQPGLKELSSYLFMEKSHSGYRAYSRDNKFVSLSDDFSYKGNWFEELHEEVISFFRHSTGVYFVLTKGGSVYILTEEGDVKYSFLIENFSSSSLLNQFIESSYGNTWLVQDQKINIIDFPSWLSKVDVRGIPGVMNDIAISEAGLYFATSKGIFKNLKEPEQLLDGNCKKLQIIHDGILTICDGKLQFIGESGKTRILHEKTWDFQFDSFSGNILFSSDSGVFLISDLTDSDHRKIDFHNTPYLSYFFGSKIYYIHNKKIFITDIKNEKQAHRTNLPETLSLTDIVGFFTYGEEVALHTKNGYYVIEEEGVQRSGFLSDNFPYHENTDIFNLSGEYLVFIDKSHRGRLLVRLLKNETNEIYERSIAATMDEISNIQLAGGKGDDFYVLLKDHLYHAGNAEFDGVDGGFPILINAFVAGSDTVFYGTCYEEVRPLVRSKLNSIRYRDNTIIIHAGTGMSFYTDYFFRYSTGGKDSGWSEWKRNNVLKLEGLKRGDYLMKIQAKDPDGNLSEEARISFSVRPPFYATSFAWFFYVFSGITIAFIFYKMYNFRMHKKADTRDKSSEEEEVEIYQKAEVNEDKEQFDFYSNFGKAEKSKGSKWDKFTMTTVLFSDIQGFTRIAEQMNPEKLIDELDQFFFHFDSVVEKYNIEKIKTIGDAYMAAGGIPRKNSTNPVEVVLAALEMQQYMHELKQTKAEIWDLRIGIHTGPVIAGVVGHKKRSYDIWGDTVNTASRMESSGEPGKVNISGITYQLVKEYFMCEYRGKLPVKYKGNIDMYFVKGLRPELSINLAGLPNRKFFLKLQLQRLQDLEEYIFSKLAEELSDKLYFHNHHYFEHIYEFSILLSTAENLDLEEALLIRTSVLLYFLGFLESYLNPEKSASLLARKILPEFDYSEKQIQLICQLTLVLKAPYEPANLLEKIMLDIKHEYLGRVDYIRLQKLLFLEHNEFMDAVERREWKDQQISLLTNYSFFTQSARKLSEVSMEEQVKKIEAEEW